MAALCRGIPGKLYSPLQKQHSHIDATFLFSNSPLCIGKPFIVRVDLGVIQRPFIGVTTVSPDVYIPNTWFEVKNDKQYWFMSGNTSYHNGEEREMKWQLSVTGGDTFGCCVKEDGKFSIYKNGEELGVAWEGLPTDQPIWAITYSYYKLLIRADYVAVDGPLYTSEYKQKKVYFPSNPPEWLFCSICQALADSPTQATCCGKLYCRVCITKWQERSNSCPNCRSTPESIKKFILFEDANAVHHINALKVYCCHLEEGCHTAVDLSDLPNHLTSPGGCLFAKVTCSNVGCGDEMKRLALENHLAKVCSYRLINCQYCNFRATFLEIKEKHIKVCLQYPLNCPNKCGAVGITRGTMEAHRRECPLEEVECEYRSVGCQMKMKRKALLDHLAYHCLYRSINCQYCNFRATLLEIQEKHMEICLQYPLNCPNKCGAVGITRGTMEAHRRECPLEEVECEYNIVGCGEKRKRKAMKNHLQEEIEDHLRMTAKELQSMKQDNANLKKDNLALKDEMKNLKADNAEMNERVNAIFAHLPIPLDPYTPL